MPREWTMSVMLEQCGLCGGYRAPSDICDCHGVCVTCRVVSGTECGTPPPKVVRETRPANEWPLDPGGLMRCDTQTWRDCTTLSGEGDELHCKYASVNPDHVMVLRAGVWEWRG